MNTATATAAPAPQHTRTLIKEVIFKVDLPDLFDEIATNDTTSICRFPLQITLQRLAKIAEIAIQHADLETLKILESLGIVQNDGEPGEDQ